MQQVAAIVVKEKAPPGGWKLRGGVHSFSKLWVKMPDGTVVIHWSLDWRGSMSGLRHQVLGLARLESLVARKYRGHAIAIVYDKATNAVLLRIEGGIVKHREFR
jgi:hypothetical protein